MREQFRQSRAGKIAVRWYLTILLVIAGTLFAADRARGQDDGAKLFETRCYSCHNIGGGDKQGPERA
ncbi:MAG: hypothetical protein R2682_13605 [Pyrinomonadaceae bacterium]